LFVWAILSTIIVSGRVSSAKRACAFPDVMQKAGENAIVLQTEVLSGVFLD